MKCLYTVCSPDYQWFIPTWAWSARKLWGTTIDIRVTVVGKIDLAIQKLLSDLNLDVSMSQKWEDYPKLPSTTNCLRFLGEVTYNDWVLITDVDLVFFNEGLWDYCEQKMVADDLGHYAAWQGAWQKPRRPEIAPNGWVGDMRRPAGGFIMVTPEWYRRTMKSRLDYLALLKEGKWATFREADEVMFGRLCVEGGMKMMNSDKMDNAYRGLHLGDFSKEHRWKNRKKMMNFLSPLVVHQIGMMMQSPKFEDILIDCGRDENVKLIWHNVAEYINSRRS